jgi:hypothetical protein
MLEERKLDKKRNGKGSRGEERHKERSTRRKYAFKRVSQANTKNNKQLKVEIV